MSMQFFSALVEMTRVMSTKFSFFGNDVISLKSRPSIFVYLPYLFDYKPSDFYTN